MTWIGLRLAALRQALWPLPVIVFLAIWGLTTHGKYSVSGDEPHYLLMAESLRSDTDLDLRDDYASGSSALFGHDNLVQDQHARPDVDARVRSVHEPGLAVLVLPVYVAARALADSVPERQLQRFRMSRGLFTYSLVSLFQAAVTCVGLTLLLDTVRRLSTPGAGTLVTAAVGLSPPVLSVGFLVFPEVPAFLIVAFVLWSCWGRGASLRWTPLACAAAIGALPWLHRKFMPFAIGLLVVLAWNRWRAAARPRADAIAAGLLFASPMLAFGLCSLAWWGTLAGPTAADRIPLSWSVFGVGAPGLLIDRENGLLVWAPIYLVAGAAWWFTRAWSWPLVLPAAALFVPSAAHDLWWGGFAPAARFLLPLVPILACVVAGAMTQPALARTFLGLCVAQIAVSAIAWQRPRMLWPLGDGHNRVLESLPVVGAWLNDALPSFRTGAATAYAGALGLIVVAGLSLALAMALGRARAPARP